MCESVTCDDPYNTDAQCSFLVCVINCWWELPI